MKHRIIPTMICDFICGAFLPVVNQPSSKSICDSLQLANDTGEIGGWYYKFHNLCCFSRYTSPWIHTKILSFCYFPNNYNFFAFGHTNLALCSCPQAIVFRNGRRQTSGNRILRSFSWNLLQIIHIWPTFVKSTKRTQAFLTSIYVWSAL